MPEEEKPAKEKKKQVRKRKTLYRKASLLDDAVLLQKSRTWQSIFNDHIADFNPFDPGLNPAFAADWLAKIDEFEGIDTDETMGDELEQQTANMEKELKITLGLVDDFEYFVKRAFPNDERKLMEFGFRQFEKIQPNYIAKVCLLSVTLNMVAADYAAELAAAGMPLTLPDLLNNQKDTLAEAEGRQEYTKRVRIRTTTTRIKKFNELYGIHERVLSAAKIVFRHKPVVAQQFE